MTKRELSKLIELEKEIRLLEEKIQKEQVQTKDTVSGSDSQFPYVKHAVVITGISEENRKYIEKLKKLKEQRIKEKNKIIEFISSLEDPLIRNILMLKYNSNRHVTWKEVSFRIYGRNDKGDALRKVWSRFFEKN